METTTNRTKRGKTPPPIRKKSSVVVDLDELESLYRRAPGPGSRGSMNAARRRDGGDTKGPPPPTTDGGDTKGPPPPADGGDTKGSIRPKIKKTR